MVEVEQRGHRVLDTGHLLLGLLHGSSGQVPAALRQAGVEPDALRQLAVAALGPEPRTDGGSIDVARATEQILQRSSEVSAARGADSVSDLDILIAAADHPETLAGRLLRAQCLSLLRFSDTIAASDPATRPMSSTKVAVERNTPGASDPGESPVGESSDRANPEQTGVRARASAEVRPPSLTRTGIGYDSHRFGDGGPLVLGGIRIEGSVHLAGHSDGDAIAHAITDAVLGAAGGGDIGEMFADTDPANRGRDSIEMLRHAVGRARTLGWVVDHVDVVVVAESPRIGPHRAAMRSALAPALGIAADAVSVKGKTNEGMGWIGRGEGIACMAVATLTAVVPRD